jgi:peptidoglycan/xylan/chitin deacetylase (PgdA/CDA1 family)
MAPTRAALRALGVAARVTQVHRWAGARGAWSAVLFHHVTDGVTWAADSPFVDGLGVTVAQDAFGDCLQYLASAYDVVPLAAVLPVSAEQRAARYRGGKRRVVICFDDAYASVAQIAAPMLANLGLPWCFFVNPAPVGNTGLAGDNAVAYVANVHGLDELSRAVGKTVSSVSEFIHGHLALRTPAQRRQLIATMLDAVQVDSQTLAQQAKLYVEAADIRALADSGVEIGNHTSEHVPSRTLTEDTLREQVIDSAATLHEISGRPVRAFAYPYGNLRDRTGLMTNCLRSSGHKCAFVVHNRGNTTKTDPYALFRISLTTGDPSLVAAEMEVLPRLRSLKAKLAKHA